MSVCVALGGCGADSAEVPEGALARVGDTVIDPASLESLNAQLGAYGQARFRGQGEASLLQSAINLELLAQHGERLGLDSDPRVAWAIVDDLAERELSTQRNERAPYDEVAADVDALRAAFDAEPDRFVDPQLRGVRGVVFRDLLEAEAALDRVRAGETTLDEEASARSDEQDQGVVSTPMSPRDDERFPGSHPFLFQQDLGEGDVIPVPLFFGRSVMIGEVLVEQGEHRDFDDPVVRERVIEVVRAPAVAAADADIESELAERYPEQQP